MKKSAVILMLLISSILSIGLTAQTVNFSGPELIGCPTDESILINIVPDDPIELYYEYGTVPGVYTAQTATVSAAGDQVNELEITDLSPNTRYYYRMRYRVSGGVWQTREEHSFMTQRSASSSFVFTVTSDSHATFNTAHQQAMTNVRNDQPDFHFDIGDTFYPQSGTTTQTAVDNAYMAYRNALYMGAIGHSVPIYLASGNHEEEEGWNLDDSPFSIGVASIQARKKFFPTPVTDGFYSGNTNPLTAINEAIYGDELREDYYAFEWGDALFVVIDQFQYTMNLPYSPTAGEGSDDAVTGDQWSWTLGEQQYNWLKETLEISTAKYKFVFSHHVTGGILTVYPVQAQDMYEVVPVQPPILSGAEKMPMVPKDSHRIVRVGELFQHPNGTPIHQLFVENGVSAYFHGHDHQYVYETLDGVVYQEVPSPSMSGSGFSGIYSTSNPYTHQMLSNSGHLRISVTPGLATVDYVRSNTTGVAYSYTIAQYSPCNA